jgi:hypothetical protein
MKRLVPTLFVLTANLLCSQLLHAQTDNLEPNAAQSTFVPTHAVPLDASVQMKPYRDPWLPSRERWRDIADNPLTAFQKGAQSFSYRPQPLAGGEIATQAPQVTLSYSTAPPVPYFIGRIDAQGLKPNFAYQLKLVGKPTKGRHGWGSEGHEWANERLGYAARWWCGHPIHASGTNFDDNHYLNEYKNALPGMEHDMYGYIYMGQFITDASGSAHVTFYGDHPYHISWQWWQGGAKDVLAGRWLVRSAPGPNLDAPYGYGTALPPTSVTLYYENEPGRTQPLTLPPGLYRCRFLITEESFHNPVASTPEGGYWKTVLASEDFVYDEDGKIIGHDRDPANDVVFSISSRPAVTAMNAKVVVKAAQSKLKEHQATAQVVVTDYLGRPIRGATVTGFWSGAHQTKEITATTNSTGIGGDGPRSDGVAQFVTPHLKAKRGQCFRFTVLNISKTGRTWNKMQRIVNQACL